MTYKQLEDEVIAEFEKKQQEGDFGNPYLDVDRIATFLRTALRRVAEATADNLTGKRKR